MTTAPPISVWGHVWRYGLALFVSGVAWWEIAAWQWEHARGWFVVDAALGLLSLVVVAWRRRFPVAVALLLNTVALGSFSSAGPALLALVSLATRRRWRELAPVTAFVVLTTPFMIYTNPLTSDDPRLDLGLTVAMLGMTVAIGLYIGSRRELLETLRSRAEIAEAEQAAKVAQARAGERTRIAREMHDVLAHRISLVAMHAGALAYRDDLPPEQVRETARTIQDTSKIALNELRTVLGVLREGPGDAVPELPQPSAGDLPTLLQEWRDAGMNVDLEVEGDLSAVPSGTGRTLFRVVQEGLTNAHKHASDTHVLVTVSADPEEGVQALVDNPLRIGSPAVLPGAGLGLLGLAERVSLAGGRLDHDLGPERHFRLRAWLPWRA